MKLILNVILTIIPIFFLSQNKVDAQDIFKMNLFLDKKNIFKEKKGVLKNDSLYQKYKITTSLKLDTLKIKGSFNYVKSVYAPQFSFYKIDINSPNYSFQPEKILRSEYLEIGFGSNSIFILAVDNKSGISYRIMGFQNSDFLYFINDYIEQYNVDSDKKININNFLNNFFVEEINFKCLYDGLRAVLVDRKKYPCLYRVQDALPLH